MIVRAIVFTFVTLFIRHFTSTTGKYTSLEATLKNVSGEGKALFPEYKRRKTHIGIPRKVSPPVGENKKRCVQVGQCWTIILYGQILYGYICQDASDIFESAHL